MGSSRENEIKRDLLAKRTRIELTAKEILENILAYRKAMRDYRDHMHEIYDPLSLPISLEDDPNWVYWTEMINDAEAMIESLREDYRRITKLM